MKVKTSGIVQQYIVVLVVAATMPFAYPWFFSSKPAIAQQPPSSSSPITPSGSIGDEAYWNRWNQRLSEIRARRGRFLAPPASYGQDWVRLGTELSEAQSRGDIPTSHQLGEALLNIEQKLRGTWVIVTVEEHAETKIEGLVPDACRSDLGEIYTERHHVFHSKSTQSGWLNYYNNEVVEYKLASDPSVWEVARSINNQPPVQPQVSVLESSGFLQSITAGMGRCLLGRVKLDVQPSMPWFALTSFYELGKNSIHYASPWLTYYPSLNTGYSWKWEQGLNPLSLSPAEIQDLLQQGVLEKTVSWMTAEPATREHYGFSETITLTLNLSLRQQRQPTEIQIATYRIPDFWPEPNYIDMEFTSCRDAENYIQAHIRKNAHLGFAEIAWGDLALDTTQEYRGITLSDGSIRAEVTIKWLIAPPVRAITLPRFFWPNMTHDERNHLQHLYDALLNHEEGHIELAEAFASANSGGVLFATGATAQEAGRLIRELVGDYYRDSIEELVPKLAKLEREYDEETQHGANQLAVQQWTDSINYPNIAVGPNVQFSCP
jgi:hypothetical protein